MSLVSPSQSNSGDTIEASDINNPVNQLAAVLNGGIDATNIADSSIGTTKIADGSVTAAKVNFGGSGSGIWWKEIGRTTLSVAGDTISVPSFVACKYLKVLIAIQNTGGTNNLTVQFNNDSGANYAVDRVLNGSNSSLVSQTIATIDPSTFAGQLFATFEVKNVATEEKFFTGTSVNSATGAASAPNIMTFSAKWVNTSVQITRIDILNGGTGDYAIGSEVVVLGHN